MYTGIDIGGTKCAVIYADDSGKIVEKVKFETTTYEETIKKIFEGVRKFGETKAIGISCGGPLDSENGIILSPPNLPGWDDVHIVEMIKQEIGTAAFLQNDANACALAEWKFGAGRGSDNMIFLTFGTGMGAGLILNGKLYDGTNGSAGEVGHIRIEKNGPVGFGKSGSFEGFCSGNGIKQIGRTKAIELLQVGKKASFCQSYADLEKINAKDIADCAKKGCADALEVYEICAAYLGYGLSILIDILNPQKIVLGSIYQRSGGLLREGMMKVLKEECLMSSLEKCDIVAAKLGDEIGDYAAIAVAMAETKQ